MKKITFPINALVLCVLMFFAACETDNSITGGDDDEATNCGDVSNSTKDFYEADAVRLAISTLNSSGSTIDPSIIIPPALINTMSDVLTAVHSSEYAARDSVVSVYDVHIFPKSSLTEVNLVVDNDVDDYEWVQSWIDNERFTGEPSIDQLLATYDLKIESITNYQGLGQLAVNLSSPDQINTEELAAKFATIDGVIDASVPSEETGDGDNITVETIGNSESYKVTYEVAYDDCSQSCQKARFYEFRVDDNCSVSYINTYGDDAPSEAERDEE